MKKSKKIAALVLSALSFIQSMPNPQAMVQGMNAEAQNDLSDSLNQITNITVISEQQLRDSSDQIFTDALDLIESYRQFELTVISMIVENFVSELRSYEWDRLDDAQRSALIDISRLKLRLYNAPCYEGRFTQQLNKAAAILAAADGSERTLQETINVPFNPGNKGKLVDEIDNIISAQLQQLHLFDASLAPIVPLADSIAYAQLMCDGLQQSSLVKEFDMSANLEELQDAILMAESSLSNCLAERAQHQ